MDLKVLLSTFGLVFLAELGDKTQLAAFCMSAECSTARFSVFLGSATALVLSCLLAVFLGDMISRYIPAAYIKIAAGILFVLMGVWILVSAGKTITS
jgi:putative Ca2+/H+ antiporter (TMEM165/GDT1 family)